MTKLITMLAIALAVPSMAGAQDTRPIQIEYDTRGPTDCRPIRTGGQAVGVAVSSVGVGLGAALIPIGMGGGSDPNSEWANRSTGAIAAGATVLALSTAGLVWSAVRLAQKRRAKARQRDACGAPVAFVPGLRW
jgi:hypothetical protein